MLNTAPPSQTWLPADPSGCFENPQILGSSGGGREGAINFPSAIQLLLVYPKTFIFWSQRAMRAEPAQGPHSLPCGSAETHLGRASPHRCALSLVPLMSPPQAVCHLKEPHTINVKPPKHALSEQMLVSSLNSTTLSFCHQSSGVTMVISLC